MPQKTLKQFIESMQASTEKKALTLLLEEDPAMSEMPAPEMAAESSGEDQIKAAFKVAINAAFDDDKLDMKGKLAKIKTILKSYESISGEGGDAKKKGSPAPSSEGGDSGSDTAKKMESMVAELATLKAKDDVRSLLESQEVRSTEDRIAALIPLSKDRRQSLCNDFKAADAKAKGVQKPPSASFLESRHSELSGKPPADGKGFMEFLKKQESTV